MDLFAETEYGPAETRMMLTKFRMLPRACQHHVLRNEVWNVITLAAREYFTLRSEPLKSFVEGGNCHNYIKWIEARPINGAAPTAGQSAGSRRCGLTICGITARMPSSFVGATSGTRFATAHVVASVVVRVA